MCRIMLPHILRMLEGTFSLDVAQMILFSGIPTMVVVTTRVAIVAAWAEVEWEVAWAASN